MEHVSKSNEFILLYEVERLIHKRYGKTNAFAEIHGKHTTEHTHARTRAQPGTTGSRCDLWPWERPGQRCGVYREASACGPVLTAIKHGDHNTKSGLYLGDLHNVHPNEKLTSIYCLAFTGTHKKSSLMELQTVRNTIKHVPQC